MKYLIALLLGLSLCADGDETYPGSYPGVYAGNIVTITKYYTNRQHPAHYPGVTFGFWANRADAELFAYRAAENIVRTNENLMARLDYDQAGNYKISSPTVPNATLRWYVETISVTNAPHLESYPEP